MYRDLTAQNGAFEWRALVYMPAATGTVLYSLGVNGGGSGINKRLTLAVDSAGLETHLSGSFTATPPMGGLVSRWIWITVRVQNGCVGAPGRAEIWLGGHLGWTGSTSTWSGVSPAGRVEFGKTTAATGVATMAIARFQYRAGLNEAPPSWTFRTLNGEVGP